MQNSYEKRINKSANRAARVTQVFKSMEETLALEANEQAQVYALLEAERDKAAQGYIAAAQALQDAHEAAAGRLRLLQERAEKHGRTAAQAADKIRSTFL